MKEKAICLFDDHGKKIIYIFMGLLFFAMVITPLIGAIDAHGWTC